MRNFYKVLGIAKSADDQRIKTAFRRRAKAVHPDLHPGNRRAEARFIELMQAYEALSDAKTRAAYDAYLAEQRAQSRRRFVHCAGLMMTSFLLTAGSAIFMLSLAGANVPFRETWRAAVTALAPADAKAPTAQKDDGQKAGAGWTTQVAAASDSPASPSEAKPAPETKLAPSGHTRTASKTQPTKSRQAAPDASGSATKDSRQQVASKRAPPPVSRPELTPEESWPPAPPPSDEPRYGLGASGL